MSALNIRLPETSPARYALDAGLSRFTVKAFASGLLSAFGHNPMFAIRDFAGEVLFLPDSVEDAKLHLTISAASLTVQDQVSDKDRREIERLAAEEVLEVSRFPHITYDCSSVSAAKTDPGQYTATLNGRLMLHGVTRIQPVEARVNLLGSMLRASGELGLKQSDYGIKLVSALGGALKVKDEVKLTFDLTARKQMAE